MHNKFLYGKKFRYFDKDRKINFLKRKYSLLFGCFIIISILFMFFAYLYFSFTGINYKLIKMSADETNLNIEELKLSEQKLILNIIDEVQPIYMKTQKSITFTHNISKYSLSYNNLDTAGFNLNKNIYIEFVNNEEIMKEVICHELLHSFFRFDDYSHSIIYDLGEQKVCFSMNERIEIKISK